MISHYSQLSNSPIVTSLAIPPIYDYMSASYTFYINFII